LDKLFWLIPDRLAGRPGPYRAPWDLADLRSGGNGAILSVNDGSGCRPKDFAGAGIAYACVPLSDTAPPEPGHDLLCRRAIPHAFDFAQRQLARGRRVVVHCSAGNERTGLFLCYFLMRQDASLSPEVALQAVRQVRPSAVRTEGWEALALQALVAARE